LTVSLWIRVGLLLVILAAVQCAEEAQKENTMQKKSVQGQVDATRAGKVPVVLRVRLLEHEGGNKWDWDKVQLVSVIKNESHYQFPATFRIAYYNHEPGVPEGESTVYLERFNEGEESLWKLLGGSGKTGVSHAAP
jgi:hypothetical protein